MRIRRLAVLLAACVVPAACSSGGSSPAAAPIRAENTAATPPTPPPTTPPTTLPATSGATVTPAVHRSTVPVGAAAGSSRPAHVVIVVEENHSAKRILGNPQAPFLDSLARTGASLTRMYAIRHPSEPNYVALFSGSTHGLTDDSCPHRYSGSNLGSELRAAHLSFAGYAEGLPRTGYVGCSLGKYARRHVPWTDFATLPGSVNKPLTALPTWSSLPSVSFVIPNLDHDMHDGTIRAADTWLRTHLGSYLAWARTHNSLLVVTWDEDDHSEGNRIPTLLAGAHVRRGAVGRHTSLYGLLRTVEDWYRLPHLGRAASATGFADLWR